MQIEFSLARKGPPDWCGHSRIEKKKKFFHSLLIWKSEAQIITHMNS